MLRAVLDPNVLVSALIGPGGPSSKLVLELHDGAFELIVSPQLLGELSEVLYRERFRRYATEDEVAVYVETIRRESILLRDPELPREQLSEDPDDEYLIALARSAPAHVLVSGDSHLLDLRDAIPVLTPREFLERIRRE